MPAQLFQRLLAIALLISFGTVLKLRVDDCEGWTDAGCFVVKYPLFYTFELIPGDKIGKRIAAVKKVNLLCSSWL